MHVRVDSDAEMERAAAEYVTPLAPKTNGATVVALSGDLGAGKTTFARGVLRAHGITETITSPTFVIEKIYTPPKGPFKRIVHVDAYRLKSAQELEALGWAELLKDSHTLILIEWPERVEGAVPDNARKLRFEIGEEEERFITIVQNVNIKNQNDS